MHTVRIFMKCMHVCAAQKANLLFTKLYIKPDSPSLENEIAEPHPDMNIKVAAFTVSEKSSNSFIWRYWRHKGMGKGHRGEAMGVLSNSGPDCLKNHYLPSQYSMFGHHLHASKTSFEWHFAGGPKMACFNWYFGLHQQKIYKG